MATSDLVPQATVDNLGLLSQFEWDDNLFRAWSRLENTPTSFYDSSIGLTRFSELDVPERIGSSEMEQMEVFGDFSKINPVATPFIPNLPFEQDSEDLSSQITNRTFRGPFVLATPLLPTGILVDAQNNIIVQAGGLPQNTNIKYDPTGRIIQQAPSASGLIVERRLASDPQSGLTVSLNRAGLLTELDPNTLQERVIGNLRDLPIDASRVYDFATGLVVNRNGSILPFQTTFGDIAIRTEQTSVDLYISGVSVVFPYIMRVRFSQDGSVRSEALAFSSATTTPNENSPPGLAVNPQGVVLTTLPTGNVTGTFNVPVYFTSDFSQGTGRVLPTRLGNGLFVSSRGMTSDAAGNFYVATSSIGITGGDFSAAGAIVVLNNTLSDLRIIDAGRESPLGRLEDIATNADGTAIYATQDLSPLSIGNERVVAYLAERPTADPLTATGVNSDLDLLTGMPLNGIENTVGEGIDNILFSVANPIDSSFLSSGQGDVVTTAELPKSGDSLDLSQLLPGNTPIELSAFG